MRRPSDSKRSLRFDGFDLDISDREFEQMRSLIHQEAGIYLPDTKKGLMVHRLRRRLSALGLTSFGDYYRHLVDGADPSEMVHMLDRISTNETRFFREARQFEFLEDELIPSLRSQVRAKQRDRLVRVWCAACSTGEEAYSLAMVLLSALPPIEGWRIDILASDLSTEALETARRGIWPSDRSGDIPRRYLEAFMLKGKRSQKGKICAGPEIRSLITFERLNLARDPYPGERPFDLIFCRNVLIYFGSKEKEQVVEKLIGRLAVGGYLFVGHAESLTYLSDRVRTVIPTVYQVRRLGRSIRSGSA